MDPCIWYAVSGPCFSRRHLYTVPKIASWYAEWCAAEGREPLGAPSHYYSLVTRDDVDALRVNDDGAKSDQGTKVGCIHPEHLPYVETFANWLADPDMIQYPTVCVQELGVDIHKGQDLYYVYTGGMSNADAVMEVEWLPFYIFI